MSHYRRDTAAYLKSQAWSDKRFRRLQIDKYTCRLCGARGVALEVHHRPDSYDLIPNESVEEHLITLCKTCHEMFHKSWARRRKSWTTTTTRATKNSERSSTNASQKKKVSNGKRQSSKKWSPF